MDIKARLRNLKYRPNVNQSKQTGFDRFEEKGIEIMFLKNTKHKAS